MSPAHSLLADCPHSGLGISLDILGQALAATCNWVAFTVPAENLLILFSRVDAEHYDRRFRPQCGREA
jgi:hypothetical protein